MHNVVDKLSIDTVKGILQINFDASTATHRFVEIPHQLMGEESAIRDEPILKKIPLIIGYQTINNI